MSNTRIPAWARTPRERNDGDGVLRHRFQLAATDKSPRLALLTDAAKNAREREVMAMFTVAGNTSVAWLTEDERAVVRTIAERLGGKHGARVAMLVDVVDDNVAPGRVEA